MFNRTKKTQPQKPLPAPQASPDRLSAVDAIAPSHGGPPAPSAPAKGSLDRAIAHQTQNVAADHGAPTVIQQDMVLTGMILTDGAVELHGVLDGDICAKGFTLGSTGMLKGDVVAEEVAIAGEGEGRITARKVRLGAGARYRGDILHQRLSVEDGAEFEGAVLRKTDEAAWSEITKTFETPGVELTDEAVRAVNALKAEFEKRNRG